MLGVGLGLKPIDFKRVLIQPKAAMVGLSLQILFLPLFFIAFLSYSNADAEHFVLPLLPAIKQLAMVTLLPVVLGMVLRCGFPVWASKAQPSIKGVST